jgi:protein O-GlcNAc transferase
LHLMGLIRLHQGRPAEALPFIERALRQKPDAAEMLANRGLALESLGRHDEALADLDRVVALQPQNSRALSNRGALLSKLGRNRDALDDLDRAHGLDPANDDAWFNEGVILAALSRYQEALQSYDRVLGLKPGHADAANNRALVLQALGRHAEALAALDALLAFSPGHAGAWVNRAALLRTLERPDEALESYDRALRLNPMLAGALASRANLLWTRKGDLEGAIRDSEQLLKVAPDYPYALGDLVHFKMHAGDWRDLAQEKAALDEGVRKGAAVAHPYIYQALSSEPSDLLACARSFAADKYPARPPMVRKRPAGSGKIRLGYVCGEFRAQATMYLAAGLFESHDRGRFDVIAFDNAREDGSAMRSRVKDAFDKFVPIQTLSDAEAAKRIADQEIDILVNLNGYFGAMRMGAFAFSPAPIQVNYLGFPGTLGADYFDYILADAEVIPPGDEKFYSEQVVRLPASYQINDAKRPVPVGGRRADHGLSDGDFVFCHFNYAYKITPEMFAVWLRLLQRVPQSVLWLLESNALFAGNIRAEAMRHGIEPSRIVFAPRLEQDDHLARLMLGDLFLDSLPYNAHTTASDALWVGLPLLTCRGTAFPGRVAASLLKATGLPELVTESLDDYESVALKLARDRPLLASYRARLEQNRAGFALFDTARTTRDIEAAYHEMMARWRAGEKPAAFEVPAR